MFACCVVVNHAAGIPGLYPNMHGKMRGKKKKQGCVACCYDAFFSYRHVGRRLHGDLHLYSFIAGCTTQRRSNQQPGASPLFSQIIDKQCNATMLNVKQVGYTRLIFPLASSF